MLNTFIRSTAVCAVLVAGTAMAADALPTSIKRTELQRSAVPTGKYVAVMVQVEINPGSKLPMHTHPGVETTYVVAGTLTVSVKGQADRTLNAGESFMVPAGTPHAAANNGTQPFKAISVYVIEADKPLLSPAPYTGFKNPRSARQRHATGRA